MAWRPLPLSASAGAQLPEFLISEAFAPSSYSIQLTDLTHIWSESLDRRAIIRRSREEGTSIDPSDGKDQLQIFLDKLKLGLAGGKDTTLALTVSAGPDRPSLVLNINVKLPGGLAPLQWPIQLAAAPQSLMTTHFTIPLLRAQHANAQDFASLAEVVKEKDHVIQKLLDKLEGQGTELGQIFPQAAGRVGRKVDRKMTEERVKGLGPFDLVAWRRDSRHEASRDIAGLVGDVFAGDSALSLAAGGETPNEEESDNWWESIKGITVNLATGRISTNGPSSTRKTPPRPKPTLRKEETVEDDDGFQVQATPPYLAQSPKRAASKLVINDSTDDNDDLDVPTQHSKIPDSFPVSPPPAAPSPKKTRNLGTIGGKKAALVLDPPDGESTVYEASSVHRPSADRSTASPTPPPPSEPAFRPRKKIGRIGGTKDPPAPEPEPEPEVERDISPPPAKTTPAPEAPKPKKGKLGQIGGKKRRAETPPAAEEEQPPETSKTAATPKRKLGAIGNRYQSPASAKKEEPLAAEASRGRASVKPEREPTPLPRETSEERADKKRLQLKRELEEKAKAPVKKKKKF